jgi:hypothetical protein
VDAHLVLQAAAVDAVALTQRAIGIDQELGHDEQADALDAGGASGRRASTRWMMLPAMSCSPALMKILLPVMR